MKKLLLSEINKIIDGRILNKHEINPVIKNVILGKSDKIKNSTLIFFPRKAKLETYKNDLKSCVIVTEKPELFMDFAECFTIVKVEDSRNAYNKFVQFYRHLFPIPVVGVTGTCGKTTTKEMIATILKEDRKIVKTISSQNSRSLNLEYLMKINEQTDAAVIEVGVGFPGGIKDFDLHFEPCIGVITNIEIDHMKGFKTHQSYIDEKAEMVNIISKNNGTIILNKDDMNIRNLDLSHFKGEIRYYGINDGDLRASNIHYNEQGMEFSVYDGKQIYQCKINCFGRHNVYNALAALAVSTTLGISLKDAIKRLQNFQPLNRHLQIRTGINQCTLIDDTWNTNSKSIDAALQTLASLANGRKTIAVLGDIEELGDLSESEHKKIGTFIHKYKINQLVTIGKEAKFIAQKAIELGMNPSDVFILVHQGDLLNILKTIADENSVVLVKASMRNSFQDTLKKLIID
ncbi:UDP-N-acetylmuramoyl-tripeptide--D-alanyl-D-alanine ligase [Lysinibacillus sp. BW-2-10]|uniref:UDP-N-acetylmuramoyl-tripeptide--D-alanyl-D- alanine ligase n=1 Tax=Lysinibacillus sp. BW-2-10 TaxID=2590030 RepID=UPI00117F7F46|nr:UDP-N-acetylmuramoyl-tripeptide--D-alanyl-D-alanine ligase [Lysinibacillus sp. BW-2-10]TSI03561.1 UDP-N-acetylmuramoyl-tripeptide--D-alanyl-D-alanine ligase [Lysinibacillus sp. BW-2-10]